ncbi:MAG: hypothetical protein H6Q75_558 [Firmicutes bacterium]|nr:hypothetical protein [Bacillota bacterium]
MQGFFLGLSTGAVCLAYCAPALVPYLLGEGKGIRSTSLLCASFLGGRLLGYLMFGIVAWGLNRMIVSQIALKDGFIGVVYLVLAVTMAWYGLINTHTSCAGRSIGGLSARLIGKRPQAIALSLGVLTGLNLCPPFLLALTNASEFNQLSQSMLFFFEFFLGTSLYFLPVPLVGTVNNRPAFRVVGKLAAVVMAVYYLYTGLIMVGGELFL